MKQSSSRGWVECIRQSPLYCRYVTQDELPPVEPLDVTISADDLLIPAGRVASVLEGVVIVQVRGRMHSRCILHITSGRQTSAACWLSRCRSLVESSAKELCCVLKTVPRWAGSPSYSDRSRRRCTRFDILAARGRCHRLLQPERTFALSRSMHRRWRLKRCTRMWVLP